MITKGNNKHDNKMKKLKLITALLLFSLISQAQIAAKLQGKLKATLQVTTEFADSKFALDEVEKNKESYKWLEGIYQFKEDGTFALTKQNKTIETGRFSADDTRIKLVFDAENLPELNAINPSETSGVISIPFSIGMTKVTILLKK